MSSYIRIYLLHSQDLWELEWSLANLLKAIKLFKRFGGLMCCYLEVKGGGQQKLDWEDNS